MIIRMDDLRIEVKFQIKVKIMIEGMIIAISITDLLRKNLMIHLNMFAQEIEVLHFNQNLQIHQDQTHWITLSPLRMSLTFRSSLRSPSPLLTQTPKG